MAATKTQRPKTREKETVFEDQAAFEVFIKEVESAARGVAVKPEGIRRIVEVLKEQFGQGLPEDIWR
ncbi:MAG: hypothetical protein G01um101438_225 [Parcubacteria group bacterium Gr01-1014_38]|nr:MAG: hypothetical protein G01um101438_225 [Parcubacteria group bacterium Gr01-1014_38]